MSAPLIDLALHFRKFVSLQHEPKARDVITLVKKTFFRTSIVRNFIPRGVKIRISARKACVKPHLRTRSDIKTIMHAITHVLNVLTAEAQSAEVQQIKRRRLSSFKLSSKNLNDTNDDTEFGATVRRYKVWMEEGIGFSCWFGACCKANCYYDLLLYTKGEES